MKQANPDARRTTVGVRPSDGGRNSGLAGATGSGGRIAALHGCVGLSVVSMLLLVTLVGCVRRTLTITTDPPHALVFLNDQEVGRSTVTSDFLWYGDYDVVIRKEGFATLSTHWDIKAPWYQMVPLDFFAEVLWPGSIHDRHSRHFILKPAQYPTAKELIERAEQTRERALDTRR